MKKSELFTIKDARKYISEHSPYGFRGYLFEKLKNNGSVIWFTNTDLEAECKYPDRGALQCLKNSF